MTVTRRLVPPPGTTLAPRRGRLQAAWWVVVVGWSRKCVRVGPLVTGSDPARPAGLAVAAAGRRIRVASGRCRPTGLLHRRAAGAAPGQCVRSTRPAGPSITEGRLGTIKYNILDSRKGESTSSLILLES